MQCTLAYIWTSREPKELWVMRCVENDLLILGSWFYSFDTMVLLQNSTIRPERPAGYHPFLTVPPKAFSSSHSSSTPTFLCSLSMYHCLNMRIYSHQPTPKIRILIDQNLRIKCHRHEERCHATLDRHQEHIANLQADQECKCHHHRGKAAVLVIGRMREGDVEVG